MHIYRATRDGKQSGRLEALIRDGVVYVSWLWVDPDDRGNHIAMDLIVQMLVDADREGNVVQFRVDLNKPNAEWLVPWFRSFNATGPDIDGTMERQPQPLN